MKLYRRLCLLATAVTLALGLTGCGGMAASPSVSPASFFLPGLVEAAPVGEAPAATAPPAPAPVSRAHVASVR